MTLDGPRAGLNLYEEKKKINKTKCTLMRRKEQQQKKKWWRVDENKWRTGMDRRKKDDQK
jgi:hypothetical protein